MGGSRRPPSKDVHADLIIILAAIPGIFRERNLAPVNFVASLNMGECPNLKLIAHSASVGPFIDSTSLRQQQLTPEPLAMVSPPAARQALLQTVRPNHPPRQDATRRKREWLSDGL